MVGTASRSDEKKNKRNLEQEAKKFQKLLTALSVLDVKEEEKSELFSVLAAMVHLARCVNDSLTTQILTHHTCRASTAVRPYHSQYNTHKYDPALDRAAPCLGLNEREVYCSSVVCFSLTRKPIHPHTHTNAQRANCVYCYRLWSESEGREAVCGLNQNG